MAGALRTLELAFVRPEIFRHEYETNLANGGVFVATREPFELREKVCVRLVLDFADQRLELTGEIVHQVTREMAALDDLLFRERGDFAITRPLQRLGVQGKPLPVERAARVDPPHFLLQGAR